jgi:inhibitor of KinA sporulation pathway (predicted exonuclease)
MSKYRIVEKPTFDFAGKPSFEYCPQYKLWNLFWIGIQNELQDYSSFFEGTAHRAIESHKTRMAAKTRKTRIIEVE